MTTSSERRPGTAAGIPTALPGFSLRVLMAAGFLLAAMVVVLSACTAAGSDQDAVQRGDEAFARGDHSEALSEYRLAMRQGRDDVEILTRTAHAYAQVGRIDEALDLYRRAVAEDAGVADLAAADLLRIARRATDQRRDGIMAAAAVEAALELRPGVNLSGLARPLAEHFSRNGQYGQALPYYQKAMGEEGEDPILILEMARAHEELGDCELALTYLEQIYDEVPVLRRSEVEWRLGHCSFEMGREALEDERLEEALDFFQVTIEMGEPRNRLAQAWFDTGEILAAMGRCNEAMQAFDRAQRDDLGGAALIQRAQERLDAIRFRRGGDGPC